MEEKLLVNRAKSINSAQHMAQMKVARRGWSQYSLAWMNQQRTGGRKSISRMRMLQPERSPVSNEADV